MHPTRKELRAWCRSKYGADWWQEDKADRLCEAAAAFGPTPAAPPGVPAAAPKPTAPPGVPAAALGWTLHRLSPRQTLTLTSADGLELEPASNKCSEETKEGIREFKVAKMTIDHQGDIIGVEYRGYRAVRDPKINKFKWNHKKCRWVGRLGVYGPRWGLYEKGAQISPSQVNKQMQIKILCATGKCGHGARPISGYDAVGLSSWEVDRAPQQVVVYHKHAVRVGEHARRPYIEHDQRIDCVDGPYLAAKDALKSYFLPLLFVHERYKANSRRMLPVKLLRHITSLACNLPNAPTFGARVCLSPAHYGQLMARPGNTKGLTQSESRASLWSIRDDIHDPNRVYCGKTWAVDQFKKSIETF